MNLKKLVMNVSEPIINPLTKLVLKKHYQGNRECTPLENSRKVLVLAPHMDDETIGLGGTLHEYKKFNTEVHCVFITDGASSNGSIEKSKVSQIRKNEIDQVKDMLGIHSIYYLDVPDGEVKDNRKAENELLELVGSIQPEVIYTTGNVDAHPDHVATAKLLSDVLKLSTQEPMIRQYEINCPVPPEEINCIIDITDSYGIKKKATEVFTSQAIAFDGFLVLASVKANLLNDKNVQYVETFIQSTKEDFIEQSDILSSKAETYPILFKQANRTVTLLWAVYKNLDKKKNLYKLRKSN
ncbi:PIG-L family deacetylase [Jeotgalibacillus sp. ET6]|uniref:PIG-L deacetylase family protein n=1 Tax=Jeotgalibacillus sp. ET6 TaxID=3037260 RepID=UPI0024185B53|nr:PIG-L family deacetylase [Jeotgalibacillus sp. ET6]MDG5471572.1 PIG-L family deacetylase [Jeotgalibacillus sp. ET6]